MKIRHSCHEYLFSELETVEEETVEEESVKEELLSPQDNQDKLIVDIDYHPKKG